MYVAQEYWHSAKGFEFKIYDSQKEAVCGDNFNLDESPAALDIKIPADGLIRLVFNGKTVKEIDKRCLHSDVDKPGVYRAEVLQKVFGGYKPWIYSNPIWVKE